MDTSDILKVKDLSIKFHTENGYLKAINDLSFHVKKGEVLGIVGESGCGKSVTSQAVLRLFDEKKEVSYSGQINFMDTNLLAIDEEKMREIRGNKISMVFQDPQSSLNPVLTIGSQIIETIRIHQNVSKNEAKERAIEMLRKMGITSPEKRIHEYPHELSGGMRQRVMIAIALACNPSLLIADEPTTALDVTIQSQILELMMDLQQQFDMSIMMITHDLGVVAQYCTRAIVMYLGEIVEQADIETLFNHPLHPYTMGLIKSIPQWTDQRPEKLYSIPGNVPSLSHIPEGCRFSTRCPFATEICHQKNPQIVAIDENHQVKCHHYQKINEGSVTI